MLEHLQHLFERFQVTTARRREQFYELAMLRSLRYKGHVARLVGVSLQPSTYLHSLYKEHPDLFTDGDQHTLQPEIRAQVRHHLLEIRREREIQKLAENILHKQQAWFSEIERKGIYGDTLSARLESSNWCERLLDLIEACYWVDPDQGAIYALAFFLAASLYDPHVMSEISHITTFFEAYLSEPTRQFWIKTSESFSVSSLLSPAQRLAYLEQMRASLQQKILLFPEPFMNYVPQLLGALWWQEGEIQRKAKFGKAALDAYKNALALLYSAEQLAHYTARLYYVFARQVPESEHDTRVFLLMRAIASDPGFAEAYGELGDLYESEKDYQQAILYYQYAIELRPHKLEAWNNLGTLYVDMGKYTEALDELTAALCLDPSDPYLYYNRALAFQGLRQFKEALADFEQALDLNLAHDEQAGVYLAYGNIYAMDQALEQAVTAYQQAFQLAPDDMQAPWLLSWLRFGKCRPDASEVLPLLELANLQPEHYLAALCRGLYAGIVQRDLPQALVEFEHAQRQEEQQWDAYFWLGLLHAYRREPCQAITKLQQALDLGLPVAFLQPLYWLEADDPAIFQQVAKLFLLQYGV